MSAHARILGAWAVCAALGAIVAPHAALGESLRIVAVSGGAAPTAGDSYKEFDPPHINDAGRVSFFALLLDAGAQPASGLFRSAPGGGVTQIVRSGDAAPDSNGRFATLGGASMNILGQAVFQGTLEDTAGGSLDNEGFFRGDGGALTTIARAGEPAPDANGVFGAFAGDASFNGAGHAAFWAQLRDTAGGLADDAGLFRSDGVAIIQVVRKGDPAPDANGVYSSFTILPPPSLNTGGDIAFFAVLDGTSGGGADNNGVFRTVGGVVDTVARAGDAEPGGGALAFLSDPVINDVEQIAFWAVVTMPAGNEFAVYRADAGVLTALARSGEPAPDANGELWLFNPPALNNAGVTAFRGRLSGTSGGANVDDRAVFRADGGALIQIARSADLTPAGDATFLNFSDPLINDLGQVAFHSLLVGFNGAPTDAEGIFCYDDADGLRRVARTGDSLLGSTITSLALASKAVYGVEASGLNGAGHVAFLFELADERSGIAVWSPAPCPGDLNGDGVVNGADLGLLLGDWGGCPGCAADLTGNDVVDGADLGLLLGAWGACP